jgi:nicotinamidase/pyrazinamidase
MQKPGESFQKGDCLLIVDVQVDFCPGGRLAIAQADQVVPVINQWVRAAAAAGVPIYASRDWHPVRHVSFKERGGKWPPHCIQDTHGARFHPDLEMPESTLVITKGVRLDHDQNSVFDETGLNAQLAHDGVHRLWVAGLALDVCVLSTVQDALRSGYAVTVIESATRPVTLDGGRQAIDLMLKAGALMVP